MLDSSTLEISDNLRTCSEGDGAQGILNQHGIYVFIEPSIIDMEIFQDEVKFRHIIGNLIKNALHHRRERIDIHLKQEGDNLVVEVKDDGPGVDPEHHQMIFRRYAQASECTMVQRKGHGLGLAGGLIIAKCLGGDIELDSHRGKGATFRLIIPMEMKDNSKN